MAATNCRDWYNMELLSRIATLEKRSGGAKCFEITHIESCEILTPVSYRLLPQRWNGLPNRQGGESQVECLVLPQEKSSLFLCLDSPIISP